MQDAQDGSTDRPARIDPAELAAILDEVRRAVLAVDADTGEHRTLRDLIFTPATPGDAETVVGR